MTDAITAKAAPLPAATDSDLLLFGLDIGKLKPKHRFAFLASGSLFCALTFAALQEKVFLIEGAGVGAVVEFRVP